MVLLTPEALNAFVLVVPGILAVSVGIGLCIFKSGFFYVFVLGGSLWSSLVLWDYVQKVIEAAEVTGLTRGMMMALPVIFFVILNAGALASMGGKSKSDGEKE